MLRKINDVFYIGTFVDADRADRQRDAGIFAALKCTDQPLAGGQREARFDFHEQYVNLEFNDAGVCATDNPTMDGWAQAKDWLKNIEGMAKANGKRVLVHSFTGAGKAIRLVAAHLAGWTTKYDEVLVKLVKAVNKGSATPFVLRPLPQFEAELHKRLTAPKAAPRETREGPMQGPAAPKKAGKGAKKKGSKTKPPQLD